MGCDIHAYVEEKIDNEWHMVSKVMGSGNDRDYEFFTHLCGVRSNSPSDGPDPKGLPDGVSVVVRKFSERWDCDGHSHSYETAKEFVDKKLVIQRLRNDEDKTNGVSYDWHSWKILEYEIHDNENIEDFRVIFWFDN